MDNRGKLSLLLTTMAIASCAPESHRVQTPIGKYDNHVKGYVVEDMPVFSSQMLAKTNAPPVINPILRWQHLDLDIDKMFGVSADTAYTSFGLTQEQEIIVAVIDSGIDINHEDLKDVMWINQKEIPGNNIDDDGNGYVDDIYGWNFIGGKDGSHINEETLEVTRIYARLLKKMQAGDLLSETEREIYAIVKKEVVTNFNKYSARYTQAKTDQKKVATYLDIIKVKLGIQNIDSREKIEAIETQEPKLLAIKKELLELWDKYWRGFAGIAQTIESSAYYVNAGYNINYDVRSKVVGDNPADFSDKDYGNNDVTGPDASHGTHVAGIIAAARDNGLGMDGIAANVKIMALRAVPNGDERDKDIALAVRYAVDNGAKIINMSFGKAFSPYKAQVDAAFQYAASKGVLLVHAAGNSALNIDGGENSYPNHYVKDGSGVLVANKISNWIEVGASTKDYGLNLIASFSNYGDEAVSLFSPGHKIYSTIPNNRYAAFSGTSMASPVAAGVAAMLMSEFPTMTAAEAKRILEKTVTQVDEEVRAPSEEARMPDFRIPEPFSQFSQTDGIINAYSAIKFARKLARNRK